MRRHFPLDAPVARPVATPRTPPGLLPMPTPEWPYRLITVVMARPRCPRCGGIALRKYRSLSDQGDGSSLAWVKCLAPHCGQRFRLLME